MARLRIPGWLAVLSIALAVYAVFPTRDFYWDGIAFARQIERAATGDPEPLAHANHLIYNYAGYALFQAASAVWPGVRALWVLQGLNMALAALAALLLYRLVRNEGGAEYVAMCVSLLFAFSATWWKYAVDSDAYVPAVFLLVCAWSLLRAKKVPAAVPALVHAAAMLFHQLALLFFPAAIAWLWKRGGARRRAVLVYCSVAGGLTALAYGLAYQLLFTGRPGGFFAWVTDHSPDSKFTFNPFHNAAMTARSSLRLLFGGKLNALQPDAISLAALAGLTVAVAVLALHRQRARGLAKEWWKNVTHSEATGPLLIWILVYMVFLFVWLPQNPFYRLFYWPAVILLAGIGLSGGTGERAIRGLAALAAIVFCWNFAFMAYPDSREAGNEPLVFARAQQRRWAPGTGIVFGTFHPDLWTIAYFNPQASWISLEDGARLNSLIERYRQEGGKLWLEATAYDALKTTGEGRLWLEAHVASGERIEWQTRKHGFRFYLCR